MTHTVTLGTDSNVARSAVISGKIRLMVMVDNSWEVEITDAEIEMHVRV